MSMVVGDSTDLINGGSGGGARNFWRSRTSFEKKLLVSMAVMAFIIVGLIIAVAVVATMEVQDSVTSICTPYSKFIDKHVCATCNTTDDALAFTKEHRKTNIPLNTVFDGHDILYTASSYSNNDTCRIMKPVKTWNCFNNKTSNGNGNRNNGMWNDGTWTDQTTAGGAGKNGTWPNTTRKVVIWTNCKFRGLCTGQSLVSNGHFIAETLNCDDS